MGDLLLQKNYTEDFLTKKQRKNKGTLPQYYVQNAHEPIVPKEIFGQVQGEFLRREKVKAEKGHRINQCGGLALNGRIFCCECGNTYRRQKNKDGARWRCRGRDDGCHGRIVDEEEVQRAVVTAMNTLPERKEELLWMHDTLEPMDEVVRKIDELEAEADQITERINAFYQEGEIDDSFDSSFDDMRMRLEEIEAEIKELTIRKTDRDINFSWTGTLIEVISRMEGRGSVDTSERPAACSDYVDFMERTSEVNIDGRITEFREEDVTRYVEKITVFWDKIEVLFKGGIVVDVGESEV